MAQTIINDPLIELLSIKLYEHDSADGQWPWSGRVAAWNSLPEDDRNLFRRIARGDLKYGREDDA